MNDIEQERGIIHIQWDGPKAWTEALKLGKPRDCGVYQIYGFHPAYGADVLLYIGKTERQKFGQRLRQEDGWQWTQDFGRVSVYVGRLAGYVEPLGGNWNSQIEVAEKLLIFAHRPACNTQTNIDRGNAKFTEIRVFNWGNYRSLLPEVSGRRHGAFYDRKFIFPA